MKDVFPRLFKAIVNKNNMINDQCEVSEGRFKWLVFFRRLNEQSNYKRLKRILLEAHIPVEHKDQRIWVGDSSHLFSIKSILSIVGNSGPDCNSHSSLVCNSLVLLRVQALFWLQLKRKFWSTIN